MRYSSAFLTLLAPLLALAAPRFYGKRDTSIDITVFKFADVLEQLESTFYSQALAKFTDADFAAAGYTSSQIPIEQFKAIQSDEASHSSVLQAAIKSAGDTPISGCQFNFDSALKDVATMAATARVVENVGVAAYLGGAVLMKDPSLLAAAGSVLTVEARHQTILNLLSSSGTAIPSAFDIALTPSEILAMAAPFISGCDTGLPANTPLTITNTGSVTAGTLLTFQASSLNGTVPDDKLFCQMMVGGQPMSIPLPISQCVVPSGINGPVAIFVTSDGQPLLNDVSNRATTQTLAGPTLAFIDTQPQSLGQLLRSGAPVSGGSSNGSATTATISPAQASAIVSNASSAGAPAPTSNGSSTSGSGPISVNNTPSGSSSSSSDTSSNPPAASSGGAVSANPSTSGSGSSSAPAPANGASAPSNGGQPSPPGKSGDGRITVNSRSM